jgi:hypothetical protein
VCVLVCECVCVCVSACACMCVCVRVRVCVCKVLFKFKELLYGFSVHLVHVCQMTCTIKICNISSNYTVM